MAVSRFVRAASQHMERKLRDKVAGMLSAAVDATADAIEAGLTTGPKTGAVRRSRKRDGSMHQASAPGEAPAEDTGGYRKSIKRDKSRVRDANSPEGRIRIGGEYAVVAKTLENGSADGKTAARPVLEKSLKGAGREAMKKAAKEA